MDEINGTVAQGYENIRDAFATAQAADPGGAQLCIYRHGVTVVDLWTGRDITKDRQPGSPATACCGITSVRTRAGHGATRCATSSRKRNACTLLSRVTNHYTPAKIVPLTKIPAQRPTDRKSVV